MYSDSFAFSISVLRKHFVAYCSERMAELGVTYSQLFILIYIGKRRQCSPKEISESLKLDAGQLNRTLSKLIEHGFVDQRKNPMDRRANIVCLTERGNTVFAASRSLFAEWDEQVLSPLDENSRHLLIDLLKQITFSMNHHMEESNYE